MYSCVNVHSCVCASVSVYSCMCMCVCVQLCACMCVCLQLRMYSCVRVELVDTLLFGRAMSDDAIVSLKVIAPEEAEEVVRWFCAYAVAVKSFLRRAAVPPEQLADVLSPEVGGSRLTLLYSPTTHSTHNLLRRHPPDPLDPEP